MAEEYTKSFSYSGTEGQAIAEFKVSIRNELISDVLISFAPVKPKQDARPTVAKFPQALIKQLTMFPVEMQGIPLGVIVKIAHEIDKDKGKSVIEEIRSQEMIQS